MIGVECDGLMSHKGHGNGTYFYECPFCHERKGLCNLQGMTGNLVVPNGFPDVIKTNHTIKCFVKQKVEVKA